MGAERELNAWMGTVASLNGLYMFWHILYAWHCGTVISNMLIMTSLQYSLFSCMYRSLLYYFCLVLFWEWWQCHWSQVWGTVPKTQEGSGAVFWRWGLPHRKKSITLSKGWCWYGLYFALLHSHVHDDRLHQQSLVLLWSSFLCMCAILAYWISEHTWQVTHNTNIHM